MRDHKGRFTTGNKASPGRKPKPIEEHYLELFKSVVDLDNWRKILERAMQDAQAGDDKARDFLASYLVGKPPHTLSVNAATAKQIAELLELLTKAGLEPSTVFNQMIADVTGSMER